MRREDEERVDEISKGALRDEPQRHERDGRRGAQRDGDHRAERSAVARGRIARSEPRARRDRSGEHDRSAAERRLQEACEPTERARGGPASEITPARAHGPRERSRRNGRRGVCAEVPRDERDREDRREAAERLGLRRVPKIELGVRDEGDGARDPSGARRAPKIARDARHRERREREAGDLDESNRPLSATEEGAGERVDQVDARRLEVPRVAVRHASAEDRPRDHRVDSLVAPVREREDLHAQKEGHTSAQAARTSLSARVGERLARRPGSLAPSFTRRVVAGRRVMTES